MKNKDYYAILEVSRNASTTEIKRAYRRLARRYHPDLHPGDKFDEDMFKAVNEAYEVLSDPVKRQEYDRLEEELSRRKEYYNPPQANAQVSQTRTKRIGEYIDRFFGWTGQIGFGWFLLAAFLLLIFLPPVMDYFFTPERDVRGVDCLKIDNPTFQEEVLESQIPVVVAFCNDATWNRETGRMSANCTYKHAVPSIVALKRIIKKGEYEDKIKFCRYSFFRYGDHVLEKYTKPELANEIIIFTNGNVFYRVKSTGSVEEAVENIESVLQEAIGEML